MGKAIINSKYREQLQIPSFFSQFYQVFHIIYICFKQKFENLKRK